MKDIIELKKNIKGNEELRTLAMDISQFIFAKSQENLVEPMPWGDEDYPAKSKAHQKPSKITDTSLLLLSGVPPYWEDSKTIVFRYDAPHAVSVEYGSPPHAVSGKRFVGWVNRKLKKKGKAGLRIAYAIATNIRKNGMDPHPFIRPSLDEAVRHFKFIQIRQVK